MNSDELVVTQAHDTEEQVEEVQDEVQAEEDGIRHGDSTIVIHPGSLHLRIGRASDLTPQTIPHCIAWKSRNSGYSNIVPWISRPETEHPEAIKMVLTAAQQAQRQLGDLHRSNGKFRQATSADQLADLNDEMEADESDVMSQLQWTDPGHNDNNTDYAIGDDALYLSSDSGYHIVWPISYGELNVKQEQGYTATNIVQSLETLWTTALERYLEISKEEIKEYKCILLIPDIFNRTHIRHMMDIILVQMGFSEVFLIQESVCAGFGVGLGSVCVVDVGDQKTSVSCVEDGISLEQTRVTLRYGGRDITRTFSWLLDHISFPYIDCQPDSNILDALLLQELKHSYCMMDTDSVGTEEIHFQVRPPGRKITKYSMHVGDERIVPTLAVFWPEMFGLKGSNLLLNGAYRDNDHTDIFDSDYVFQTRSKQEESARLAALKKKEQATSSTSQGQQDDLLDDSQRADLDEDMDAAAEEEATLSQNIKNADGSGQLNSKKSTSEEKLKSDELLALDQAILWSIDQCEGDEMKRRMYSNILLVGGGLLFEGVESLLQYRVWLNSPAPYRQSANIAVLTRSKELDPQAICWKGGAVLSILDTVGEQWISQEEWLKYQSRIVREKAPFNW